MVPSHAWQKLGREAVWHTVGMSVFWGAIATHCVTLTLLQRCPSQSSRHQLINIKPLYTDALNWFLDFPASRLGWVCPCDHALFNALSTRPWSSLTSPKKRV